MRVIVGSVSSVLDMAKRFASKENRRDRLLHSQKVTRVVNGLVPVKDTLVDDLDHFFRVPSRQQLRLLLPSQDGRDLDDAVPAHKERRKRDQVSLIVLFN
jgi:hypothetical protein